LYWFIDVECVLAALPWCFVDRIVICIGCNGAVD
jgi:hypothetical protein